MPTRGTTAANRLRRADRWMTGSARITAALASVDEPIVVDLGYGRLPVTTTELATRLRAVAPRARVVGLEIDPQRVADAQSDPRWHGVEFGLGGFELAGLRPVLVRAFNVLRQYPLESVGDAWRTMQAQLQPDGLIIDGTCDEVGRRACWVLLDRAGPVSLTLACDPRHIDRPSDLAERLPKVLIHHNVPGQPINALLRAADNAWAGAAAQSVFGPRARWRSMLSALGAAGVRLQPQRGNRHDAVLTVPWDSVAPVGG